MAAIKGKNTRPEMVVRRGLHRRGLRFRLHRGDLPGRPDLVFPSRNIALFVHGCFWHAHAGCRYFKLPDKDRERWSQKLKGNRARDARNQSELISRGWRVIVIWECELRQNPSSRLDDLAQEIREGAP